MLWISLTIELNKSFRTTRLKNDYQTYTLTYNSYQY